MMDKLFNKMSERLEEKYIKDGPKKKQKNEFDGKTGEEIEESLHH